ncbi:hypothetical protein BDZ94DRAFT_1320413 [Collybia nuda]|uniref:Uncharacterized protein n=1 Tax=Collybia nuda TaxID=64659 RepID=A0A9P5YAY9_9AGAR|nr:hypothetical protein BDZ94DRAFT_1320413 [Collybia nuda]
MPTTRRQAALQGAKKGGNSSINDEKEPAEIGEKRDVEQTSVKDSEDEPPSKKTKPNESSGKDNEKKGETMSVNPQTETIERGHIYFFYRPRVQLPEAHSLDDVKNFHMLLVPRPPDFSVHDGGAVNKSGDNNDEDTDMTVLTSGADAVPAPEALDESKKHYRLITVGKKHLPDPEQGGKGKGRKETFWATVTAVGDDLNSLEKGLGEKTYETKTRGTRHEEPARLAARGAYAIVNNEPRVPSERTTHLGYHLSHPAELSEVQTALGISTASSLVVQVKNPLAPAMNPQQSHAKGADYPNHIMSEVFGKGSKGRESYGLRFVSCERPELLDYMGAQLLLIASKGGDEGLEESLGEGRGAALHELEEQEGDEAIQTILRELDMDSKVFPAAPLEGNWI